MNDLGEDGLSRDDLSGDDLSGISLFHRLPRRLAGDRLVPLSVLHVIDPDLAETYAAKYAGRARLAREVVPPLACTWADVVFLCAVHPALLLDAARRGGRVVPTLRFVQIDAGRLAADALCLKHVRPWGPEGYVYRPEAYHPVTRSALEEAARPSARTIRRLECLPADDPLILWSDVTHVLYRGEITVADGTVIDC